MSGYNVDRIVSEMIYRTKSNIGIVNKYPRNDKYEITLLINSMFSFVVLPYEMYSKFFLKKTKRGNVINLWNKFSQKKKNTFNFSLKDDIDKIKKVVKECINGKRYFNSYPDVAKVVDEWGFLETLNFIRHIRNSISHSGENLFFVVTGEGASFNKEGLPIKSIQFRATLENAENSYTFCIEIFTDKELEQFINLICDFFINLESVLSSNISTSETMT